MLIRLIRLICWSVIQFSICTLHWINKDDLGTTTQLLLLQMLQVRFRGRV